jgi:hypothetical protein
LVQNKIIPHTAEKTMIRKHQTTAEMVKKLLNVIETRVERANQKSPDRSGRMQSSLERSTI